MERTETPLTQTRESKKTKKSSSLKSQAKSSNETSNSNQENSHEKHDKDSKPTSKAKDLAFSSNKTKLVAPSSKNSDLHSSGHITSSIKNAVSISQIKPNKKNAVHTELEKSNKNTSSHCEVSDPSCSEPTSNNIFSCSDDSINEHESPLPTSKKSSKSSPPPSTTKQHKSKKSDKTKSDSKSESSSKKPSKHRIKDKSASSLNSKHDLQELNEPNTISSENSSVLPDSTFKHKSKIKTQIKTETTAQQENILEGNSQSNLDNLKISTPINLSNSSRLKNQAHLNEGSDKEFSKELSSVDYLSKKVLGLTVSVPSDTLKIEIHKPSAKAIEDRNKHTLPKTKSQIPNHLNGGTKIASSINILNLPFEGSILPINKDSKTHSRDTWYPLNLLTTTSPPSTNKFNDLTYTREGEGSNQTKQNKIELKHERIVKRSQTDWLPRNVENQERIWRNTDTENNPNRILSVKTNKHKETLRSFIYRLIDSQKIKSSCTHPDGSKLFIEYDIELKDQKKIYDDWEFNRNMARVRQKHAQIKNPIPHPQFYF